MTGGGGAYYLLGITEGPALIVKGKGKSHLRSVCWRVPARDDTYH